MLSRIHRALTSRAAGPAASAVALALAVTLGASWSGWTAQRRDLEARIAQLSQQSARAQSVWRAQLAACQGAATGARRLTETAYAARTAPGQDAGRLLAEGPAGIDGCARMESADQTVLSTLK